jgi:hypothetical protein
MNKAGYKMIRRSWVDAAERPLTLFPLGEHASTGSITQVWQTE